MKVKEIMTTRVVTAAPDTPVPVIAGLLRDNRIGGVPVVDAGDVMTASVVTVTEDTDVEDVRHLLVERRIRRVPVLSGGQRLAGIVSRGDVVALLTAEWVCQVCGEAARGQHPPARCPKCHARPGPVRSAGCLPRGLRRRTAMTEQAGTDLTREDPVVLREYYRQMALIRAFELRAAEMARAGRA